MKPFSEDARFEQGNSNDPFYSTGSAGSIGETPGSFSRSLFSKEQIKVSFPVTVKTPMLPNSCSIYYFNPANGIWSLPENALSDIRGPIEKIGLTSNLRPPPDPPGVGGGYGQFFIEDFIAFNYRGIPLVSGSLSVYRTAPYYGPWIQRVSDVSIFNDSMPLSALDRNTQSGYMMGNYPKTININPDYTPRDSQTFTLPITAPFLIEKIVMEVPFCIGNGWLYDKTTTCFVTSSGADVLQDGAFVGELADAYFLEQGGPGLTVAIYSKKLYGTGSILDLVSKNFITHAHDTIKEVKLRKYFDSILNLNFDILGVNSSSVDTVINLQPPSSFTGSIEIRSKAEISNGVNIYFDDRRANVNTTSKFYNFASSLISQKYFKPTYSVIGGVDAFGRASTGFSPSGGSIFGGEFVTSDTDSLTTDGAITNPYYIEDLNLRNQTLSSLADSFQELIGGDKFVSAVGDVFIGSSKSSPYLVYPGEKLLLAISKTRPAMATMKVNFTTANLNEGKAQLISSSYYNDLRGTQGHDIQLNTGIINMTFYGSYVRAGDSYTP